MNPYELTLEEFLNVLGLDPTENQVLGLEKYIKENYLPKQGVAG